MIPVLIIYTILVLGAWGLIGVIYAHIRDYWNFSRYIPIVFPILLIVILSLTIIGYFLVLTASYDTSTTTTTTTRTNNNTSDFRPTIEY